MTCKTLLFLVFNCVCGVCVNSILNRLTPEKFDKLSFELLNVGIDSQLVLKGIIILVRSILFVA
jgi:hypothetical protein